MDKKKNTVGVLEEMYFNVKKKAGAAAIRSGRKPEDIKIIAVTKTKPVETVKNAYLAGMKELGENRVQELCEKYEKINNPDIAWHLIGSLQTNKVKYIIDKVKLIHSLDRFNLAREINKKAKKAGISLNVLIQVNISKEETKAGIYAEELYDFITSLHDMENIKVKGLMTIAPYTKNTEEIRYVFKKLREISVDIKSKNIDNICMDILSMGMSNDYEAAVEEGATLIRIGSSIFGERG